MWTSPHWIEAELPGRLGIMPRPRGADWLRDEIHAWKRAGISIVISLLEPAETEELELFEEQALCEHAGIEFLSLPIMDRGVPSSFETITQIAKDAWTRLVNGQSIVVHCRAGIGRSSLVAGCILVSGGYTTDRAIELIRLARGLVVPDTETQLEWLRQFEARTAAR